MKTKQLVRRQTKLADELPAAAPGATPASPAARPAAGAVPVVGIGASAGGLEALELFLGHVPPACGLAFVVVQHLDPNHKGILVELLQHATAMPVAEITDQTKVEPDHVYVIPPNRDLSILHGVLHLLEPAGARGLRLPIDFFFRSLADDQHEHAIGVVLSGMGSDGTLGLRAIKEKAGAVFVQTPASATCDGMPRSAIDAGLADVVDRPEALAGAILVYLQHAPLPDSRPDRNLAESAQSGLEKVLILLRARTGHDFSLYKRSTISRRVERRMSLQQLTRIADYIRFLRENPQETELLFHELLIGVTSFFRDPAVWEQLKTKALPALLAAHPDGGTLRAWVAGCSTGEEAYSLAVVFREAVEVLKPAAHYGLQIFATDLDKDAIDKARAGTYPANIATDVGEVRLRRFFAEEGHGYRVDKQVRDMVIFAPQNLVMDPPFTRLDLLTCRNLLIYLETEMQKKLLRLFHYSLNPGGILVLGNAETIGAATDLFLPQPGKLRVYRRENAAPRAAEVAFPAAYAGPRDTSLPMSSPSRSQPLTPNLETLTASLLLQRYSPAAVLTNDKGDILYFSGRTSTYLEPPAGKANLNVFAMARTGLGIALNEAFHKAVRQQTEVTLRSVNVGVGRSKRVVDVKVQPLTTPDAARGMVLVVFEDQVASPVPAVPGRAKAAATSEVKGITQALELERCREELQISRQELETTREEMQASQEELKSANEELQSTNEELQSTNEELMTSKEEMQSMNEELQTTNHELRAKVEELSLASDDMKNLLNSTDIATLFLDGDLKVRRFTTQTTKLIKLIPGDVGRPITDIVCDLDYRSLADDAREVLRSLVFRERHVATRDGRWFTVRIMPYRTQDNRIDGVVITFLDIATAKALEATVLEALEALKPPLNDPTAHLVTAATLKEMLLQARALLEARLPPGATDDRLQPVNSPEERRSKP